MEFRKEVEALIFASSKYMTEEEIAEYLKSDKAKVRNVLEKLKDQYDKADNSLAIVNNINAWKMTVKPAFLPIARKIVSDTELEKPVLETLAVIAWKRPILQSEVIDVRGSHAYEHVKELAQLGFVTKEKHGRSYKLKLAEKFFEYFDVEGDADVREIFSMVQRPEPKKLGELDVVDLEKEKQEKLKADLNHNKLGELEIVDPLEKWKAEHEELDDIDKELDKISARTDAHVQELDKYKPEEVSESSEENFEEKEIDESA